MSPFAVPLTAGQATIRFAGSSQPGTDQERAMGERSPSTASSARASEDRLDSWKEIAAYLNRDVKTVQRWEKREAMPVHRHQHDRMGSVYASRAELDAWTQTRNLSPAHEDGNGVTPPTPPVTPPTPIPPSPTRWKVPLLIDLAAT